MSEAAFKRSFDAAFFGAWGAAVGGIDGVYTSPAEVSIPVQVLVDTNIAQFGDDYAPVSAYSTVLSFRREQVEPESGAVVVVDGVSYTLAQRIESSDESLRRWSVRQ